MAGRLLEFDPMRSLEASRMLAELPEGDGLAANYPGDVGIEEDPAVILADGFEDCASPADLSARWNSLIHPEAMAIAEDPANVHSGKRALQFTIPKQEKSLSIGADTEFTKETDILLDGECGVVFAGVLLLSLDGRWLFGDRRRATRCLWKGGCE